MKEFLFAMGSLGRINTSQEDGESLIRLMRKCTNNLNEGHDAASIKIVEDFIANAEVGGYTRVKVYEIEQALIVRIA